MNGSGARTFGAGPPTLSFNITSKGRPGRSRAYDLLVSGATAGSAFDVISPSALQIRE
jgi:hypothetical protein